MSEVTYVNYHLKKTASLWGNGLVVIVGGLVVTAGCGDPNVYQRPPVPTVIVAQSIQKTITNYLEETGSTEPVEIAEIRARVRGFLEEVRFEPGTMVQKDQVLYLIEQQEYQSQVQALSADVDARNVELEKAKIELDREEQMFAERATAERNVVAAQADRDGALADLAAAKATLNRAKMELAYTEVRAPFAGRVGKTLIKVGNLVDGLPASHLTTIVSYDPIYANFTISEQVLLKLREASRKNNKEVKISDIEVFLQRASDQGFPFKGHLDYTDLGVDQSTGTFAVRAIFPNPDREILPGLFVRIRLPAGIQENAILIPQEAVGADQASRYVLVVNSDNEVNRKNITVGTKFENMIVIHDGLDPTDWVIVEGLLQARPGTTVKPKRKMIASANGDLQDIRPASADVTDPTPQGQAADKRPQ